MKTLSQHNKDLEEARRVKAEADDALLARLEAMNIGPSSTKMPASFSLKNRDAVRNMIRKHEHDGIGLACDGCGTELWPFGGISPLDMSKLMIGCPGCGWVGSVSVK